MLCRGLPTGRRGRLLSWLRGTALILDHDHCTLRTVFPLIRLRSVARDKLLEQRACVIVQGNKRVLELAQAIDDRLLHRTLVRRCGDRVDGRARTDRRLRLCWFLTATEDASECEDRSGELFNRLGQFVPYASARRCRLIVGAVARLIARRGGAALTRGR